jgi:hypothetical protein
MRLRFSAVVGSFVLDPSANPRPGDMPRFLGRTFKAEGGADLESRYPIDAEGFEVEAGSAKARFCTDACAKGELDPLNADAAKRSGFVAGVEESK